MKAARQTTLRDIATVTGIGVHSGLPVTLSIHPADANYGISFMRTGIDSLVLENFLLDKADQPAMVDDGSWQKEFQLD